MKPGTITYNDKHGGLRTLGWEPGEGHPHIWIDVQDASEWAWIPLTKSQARRLARALLKFADGASKPKRKGGK